ncbi:MAG: bifunctional 4-hydroxy-2-oxoglutarate aldolase/2-dehydro-3-deoxy-phosphogluconate aldolase [Kiritimatiellae bacterium]|nr:bifunctional 4-hydroxy-2-oxoglutarate aldolase/2-dehydro-3-deoxy-phosphogluconate aldolase [Kiritimatiellia bacterium]
MKDEIFPESLAARITRGGNIAVAVVEDPDCAVPLARALLAGGVEAIELAFRTPRAAEALRRIASEVPEALVGAGTVLDAGQVRLAKDCGAAFAVAPGFNPDVVRAAADAGLPFAPGVMTPSEIEGAFAMGCTRIMKFFPATVAGGLPGLRTLAAPYKHLGVKFIPLGGLKEANTAEWLADPLVAACGGSWIAPAKLVAAHDWAAIEKNAAAAAAAAKSARGL